MNRWELWSHTSHAGDTDEMWGQRGQTGGTHTCHPLLHLLQGCCKGPSTITKPGAAGRVRLAAELTAGTGAPSPGEGIHNRKPLCWVVCGAQVERGRQQQVAAVPGEAPSCFALPQFCLKKPSS